MRSDPNPSIGHLYVQKSASTTGIGLDYYSDKTEFDSRATKVDKGSDDDEGEEHEQQQQQQQQELTISESDSPAAISNLVLTGANGGFQEVSAHSPTPCPILLVTIMGHGDRVFAKG